MSDVADNIWLFFTVFYCKTVIQTCKYTYITKNTIELTSGITKPEGSLPQGHKHVMSPYPRQVSSNHLLQISNDVILPPNFQPTMWARPLQFS